MDIKENIEEWKRIYESTLTRKYNLTTVTEARRDDDDDDESEEDSDEMRELYGDYYRDTKEKVFLDIIELYYVPKKGEDPLDHIFVHADWFNEKMNQFGKFRVFDEKTEEFPSVEDARKEIIKRFSELRRKYKGIKVENFRIVNEEDIPSIYRKQDPNTQGFIYNYIPTSELVKSTWTDGAASYTDGNETHTMDGWAKKLGITYQQFAKAIRTGEVKIKKDKDGNKIEPYTIDGNKYKKVENSDIDIRRRYQNPDKSIMMFMYFIYKSPHKLFRKSAESKLAEQIIKLNSSPEYYAEVQRKMIERKKAISQ